VFIFSQPNKNTTKITIFYNNLKTNLTEVPLQKNLQKSVWLLQSAELSFVRLPRIVLLETTKRLLLLYSMFMLHTQPRFFQTHLVFLEKLLKSTINVLIQDILNI